jgi:hypothetical protein
VRCQSEALAHHASTLAAARRVVNRNLTAKTARRSNSRLQEANAERKSQTEKLFILFAELRGDVNDLQLVVQPLRRLDN